VRQKKVTVKGTEYTLQHPGVRAKNQIMDRIQNKHGVPSNEKLADEICEHVVVLPKVRQDDFNDDPEAFEELMKEATSFLRGKKVD